MSNQSVGDTYKIIRYFAGRSKRAVTIKTGVTLEEAQEHCQRDDTHEDGVWFDGWTKEETNG